MAASRFTVLPMEHTHVLGELHTYRHELMVELQRVEAALSALATSEDEAGPRLAETGTGTYDLLRKFFRHQPRFDAPSALDYLIAEGWKADARSDALNTVRSALAHLAAWGEIERVRRGVYRAAPPLSRKPLPSANAMAAV